MKKVFFSKAKNERKRRKSLPFSDEQLLSALSQMHYTLSRMWIGYLISHFRHQFQMPRVHLAHHAHLAYKPTTLTSLTIATNCLQLFFEGSKDNEFQ